MTDECGNVVWANYEFAWGGRYTHHYATQSLNGCAIIESDLQPIRFQGQFYDIETGLHYNRFRYYDSDVGMFISRDPIGLLGGYNIFQYADNPVMWIDPFGLTANLPKAGEDLFVGTYSTSYSNNVKSGLNSTHTPHHVIQNAASPTSHGKGITINIRKDLHKQTWTYKKPMVKGLTDRQRLARDVKDLRKILSNAGYDKAIINQQMQELIRQNKQLWLEISKGKCT